MAAAKSSTKGAVEKMVTKEVMASPTLVAVVSKPMVGLLKLVPLLPAMRKFLSILKISRSETVNKI